MPTLCTLVFLTLTISSSICITEEGFCPLDGPCESKTSLVPKYFLYDVNPPEGFNLRRDVYMRLAIFMHKFSKNNADWHLVLPPWHHLYHWRSRDIGDQTNIPWSHFFDIDSMRKFAPVIEFNQFLHEWGSTELEEVYVLQHYADAFKPGYRYGDKWDVEPCNTKHFYKEREDGSWEGWFWGHGNLTTQSVECISYEGSASTLGELLDYASPARSVVVDRAEVVLHEYFGDKKYWECRKSMKFSKELLGVAKEFRRKHFNFTDNDDLLPSEQGRGKSGGTYLGIHLRRRDFLSGRSSEAVPLPAAAQQILQVLAKLKLSTVFIATDTIYSEFEALRSLLSGVQVVRFEPSVEERRRLKDGGVAIIDQIICSHARWFIGTHESTFSFRIQEEREILGFPVESTFNRLCPGPDKACEQPTKWTIVK